MTPGQIAFVVLVTVVAVAISATLFMQQWVNERFREKDKVLDDRIKALETDNAEMKKAMTEGGALYFPHKLSKVRP